MSSVVRLIQLASKLSARDREATARALASAAAQAPGALETLFEPTCPGVYNGGDFIWRAAFRDEAARRAAEASGPWRSSVAPLLADRTRVESVEQVAFAHGTSGGVSPRRGLYRVALFCANRNPTPERLARFAAEACAMPRHVRSIRRWQLATATEAGGTRPWSHVWEQEYDDLAGLTGPYMLHPCHWSQVDRWFDPEDPDWLVDTLLCHSFCQTDSPVIHPGP